MTFRGFKKVTKNIEISDKAPAFLSIVLQRRRWGTLHRHGIRGSNESKFSPGADISYVKRVDKVDVRGLVRDDLGSALAGVTVKLKGTGPFRTNGLER